MRTQHPPFWIGLTIIFTIIFILFFSNAIIEQYGILKTVAFTLIGVFVIWIVYFIRAYIFSNIKLNENDDANLKE